MALTRQRLGQALQSRPGQTEGMGVEKRGEIGCDESPLRVDDETPDHAFDVPQTHQNRRRRHECLQAAALTEPR